MPNKIDHNLISMLTNIMRRDECGLVDHNIFELVVAIMTSTVQFAYIPMDVRAQCKWHHGDRGVDSVSWTVREDGDKKYKMEHLVQAKDVHGEVAFRSAATFFSQGLLCGQNISGNVCLPYMTIVGNEETSLNYVPDHIVSMYPEKMKHSEISMALTSGFSTIFKLMVERRKLKESRKLESQLLIWKRFRDEEDKNMDIIALGKELTIAECESCARESGGETITQQLLGIQLLDEYLRKSGRSSVPNASKFRHGWEYKILRPIRELKKKDFESLIESYLTNGFSTIFKLMVERRKSMIELMNERSTKRSKTMKLWKRFRDEEDKEIDVVALQNELTIAECLSCASECGETIHACELINKYIDISGRSSVPCSSKFYIGGWRKYVIRPSRNLDEKKFKNLMKTYLNNGWTSLCKVMVERRKLMNKS